jgi:hypothetical protein
MRNHLLLIAGLLLSSCLPIEAQTPGARIVLAETTAPPALPAILFRASRVRSSTELPDSPLPEKPLPRPAFLLAAEYEPEATLESRLPIDEFRSPLVTEASVPVVHLWRGLKVDVFEMAVHPYSLERGSPTSGVAYQDVRPASKDQAAIANSVGGNGLSLRYTFGRDATSKPAEMWRCVSWVTGNGRGCPL